MSEIKYEKIGEQKEEFQDHIKISWGRKSVKKFGNDSEEVFENTTIVRSTSGMDPLEITIARANSIEKLKQATEDEIKKFWREFELTKLEKQNPVLKSETIKVTSGDETIWNESATGKSKWCTLEDLRNINSELYKIITKNNPIGWKNAIPFEGYRYCIFGDNNDLVGRAKIK